MDSQDEPSRAASADAPPSSPRSSWHATALIRPLHRPIASFHCFLKAAVFPLRGICYFARHPELYTIFAGRLLPLSLISAIVYLLLFTFAFLPQFAFLAIFHGWGAWVNAVVLVLAEGLVIIQGLFEGFFVDECRVDVFDATLLDQGFADLIAPQRVINFDAANTVKMLGKPTLVAVYQPWSFVQIVELIVCLPLNLIPYVGTPAFILITGRRLGLLAHFRWFRLRQLDRKTRKAELHARGWEYLGFGTVAMLLELVPILSFFFLLTTAAGSALWAVAIEQQSNIRERGVDEWGSTGLPPEMPR